MNIHKEGFPTLIISAVVLGLANGVIYFVSKELFPFFAFVSLVLYLFLISFFRNPDRQVEYPNEHTVLSPCDGKVVVIEETIENEFLQEQCIQISIFMSPLNVHVNRHPVSGLIKYFKYHPGKYLAAWNPKASTENERTTIVYQTHKSGDLVVRQIAGALARRIVCYAKEGQQVTQGDELGFIKLGSRMDLFLPLGSNIHVNVGDVVKGNINKIADLV